MAARIARRLALAALVLAASTALAVESKSVVLTNANFDEEVLHDTRSAFVLFFAPWCGHCKALKPSWEELAGMYDRSSELLIGQVDCTADNSKALCERYDVEGFPDVKFFEAGNPEPDDYEEDERSVEAFVAYAKKALQDCKPSSLELCSDEDKKIIENYKKLSPKARAAEMSSVEGPIEAAKKELARIAKLVEELEEQEEEAEEKLDDLRKESARKLKLMKLVDMS